MLWLDKLNYYLLQWFFVRLYQTEPLPPVVTATVWGLMFPVVPLTGWTTKYKPTKRIYFPLLSIKPKHKM